MVDKFPVWVSRTTKSSTSSEINANANVELIHCVGVFDNPDEALERVGEIISSLGARALVIRAYKGSPEPSEGLSAGVEAYDPEIPLRFVVFGLELADPQEDDHPVQMRQQGLWGPQKVILS
jgi:hypothetical protein